MKAATRYIRNTVGSASLYRAVMFSVCCIASMATYCSSASSSATFGNVVACTRHIGDITTLTNNLSTSILQAIAKPLIDKFITPLFLVTLPGLPPTCKAFFGLFTHTKFIRTYVTVAQQPPVTKCQKCTRVYGDWSIFFMENCTPDVIFAPIGNPYIFKLVLF